MTQQSFKRSAAINHGTHRQHRIKPVSKLARKAFKYQICREPLVPVGAIGCESYGAERHDARVEPGIADVFDPRSKLAAFFTANLDGIDVRAVRRVAFKGIPASH